MEERALPPWEVVPGLRVPGAYGPFSRVAALATRLADGALLGNKQTVFASQRLVTKARQCCQRSAASSFAIAAWCRWID